MNQMILSTFVSLILSLPVIAESPTGMVSEEKPVNHPGKTGEEMASVCEEHINKIKDTGASLPPEMKAEFDYNIEIAGIELKALRDPNHHKDSLKHAASCRRHVNAAHIYVKKQEKMEAVEKRREERKARAEERKAKAEERRKAKAEEKKAKKTKELGHDKMEASEQHDKEEAPGQEEKKS